MVPFQTFNKIKRLIKKGKYKNMSSAICELLDFALMKIQKNIE